MQWSGAEPTTCRLQAQLPNQQPWRTSPTWHKSSHIFRTGRPTNFNSLYGWNTMTHITNMCSDRKGQRSKVITWHHHFDASAHNSTKKSRRSIKTGRKVVRAMGDIAHQFQGQKVKVKVTRWTNDLRGSSSHHLLGAGHQSWVIDKTNSN